MITECTIKEYISGRPDYLSKIQALDMIIDNLMLSLTEASEGTQTGVLTYEMDDGQVRIKTTYRSISEMKDSILALEQLRQMYINRQNGRIVVLRDSKSFRR